MVRTFIILSAFFVLVSNNSAYALKQHRCNGLVQYKPCVEGAPKPVRPVKKNVRASYDFDKKLFARVFQESFSAKNSKEGIWKGRVEGNGDIHMQLYILRGGKIEDTRYMGHVQLTNKSTSFKFQSSIPAGSNWSWKIRASAV